MKIDVYALARNEEVLMPYFLRHYGSFAERIFIFEDGSTDATREICQSHPSVQLMPVKVSGIDDRYFTEFYSKAYRNLSRGFADWVMCVDVDEFVYHPELSRVLEYLLRSRYNVIRCEGWNMIASAPPTGPAQIYDEIDRGIFDPWFHKPVVLKPEADVDFMHGRHNLASQENLVIAEATGIKMLHYRYLGEEYFQKRNDEHVPRLAEWNLKNATGTHILPTHGGHSSLRWYQSVASKAVLCV